MTFEGLRFHSHAKSFAGHVHTWILLRDLIAGFDREIVELDGWIHRRLRDDAGYRVIQQLNGVGRVHAAVFVAEIGDVTRFTHPRQLCSWAGLTRRLRVSDSRTYRGHITKRCVVLMG